MPGKAKADKDLEKSLAKRLNNGSPRPDMRGPARSPPPSRKGKRPTAKRNDNIIQDRLDGLSAAEIAAKYSLHKNTVRHVLFTARKEGKLPEMLPEFKDPKRQLALMTEARPEDGKGAAYKRAAAIGRQYMSNALLRLVELAELNKMDDQGNLLPLSHLADKRVVVVAVRDYLNRVVGSQPIKDPEVLAPNAKKFDPSIYTPEQLAQIEQTLRMVAAAQANGEDDR